MGRLDPMRFSDILAISFSGPARIEYSEFNKVSFREFLDGFIVSFTRWDEANIEISVESFGFFCVLQLGG